MNRLWKLVFVWISLSLVCWSGDASYAQANQYRIARLAEIEIDPQQLASYKAALREEIETSLRLEPGVMTLYAASVKDHPEQIRVFEIYASQAAYQAHLQTCHLLKYKTGTKNMVRSLKLFELDAISLDAKK